MATNCWLPSSSAKQAEAEDSEPQDPTQPVRPPLATMTTVWCQRPGHPVPFAVLVSPGYSRPELEAAAVSQWPEHYPGLLVVEEVVGTGSDATPRIAPAPALLVASADADEVVAWHLGRVMVALAALASVSCGVEVGMTLAASEAVDVWGVLVYGVALLGFLQLCLAPLLALTWAGDV